MEPGTPLRQSILHETYGIGWTPLREALSRLESERLVTVQRNRGYAVAPVSHAELEDLSKARCTLELALLEASIAQGNANWEETLVVAHYRLKNVALPTSGWVNEDVMRWLDHHQSFHRCLVSGSDAPWLLHLYDKVMDQERRHFLALTLQPALRGPVMLTKAMQEAPFMVALRDATDIGHHTDLMDAALSRNTASARTLMMEHVRYKGDLFALASVAVDSN